MLFLQKSIALVAAFLLCAQPVCLTAQTGQPQAAQDKGWPRQVTGNGSTLIYYQPQIDDWKDYKELDGRAAVALTPQGGKTALGVVSFQADTAVNKDTRTVYFNNLKYTSVRFQSLDAPTAANMEQHFRALAAAVVQPVSLDRVMADMNRGKISGQSVQVKNDPPQIFYSSTPAILLMVEGQPILNPIEKTDLQSVINTNWDLFFDKSKKQYYLLVNATWLASPNLQGPWTATGLP